MVVVGENGPWRNLCWMSSTHGLLLRWKSGGEDLLCSGPRKAFIQYMVWNNNSRSRHQGTAATQQRTFLCDNVPLALSGHHRSTECASTAGDAVTNQAWNSEGTRRSAIDFHGNEAVDRGNFVAPALDCRPLS